MKWYEAGHSPKKGDKFVFIGADEPAYNLRTGDTLEYVAGFGTNHSYKLLHNGKRLRFSANEIEPQPDSNAGAKFILEEENTWK